MELVIGNTYSVHGKPMRYVRSTYSVDARQMRHVFADGQFISGILDRELSRFVA